MRNPLLTPPPVGNEQVGDAGVTTKQDPFIEGGYGADPNIEALVAQITSSGNNKPMANTTLPPNYYFPKQGENVLLGNVSTPMGSMPIFGAGAGLFPYSVLDAIEQEENMKQARQFAEMTKPYDLEYFTTINPNLKRGVVNQQYNKYQEKINEYTEKYGGYLGRKMLEKTGELGKLARQFEADMAVLDAGTTYANQILKDAGDADKYVSPTIAKHASDLTALSYEDFESYDDMVKAFRNQHDKLVSGISTYKATEKFIENWNELSIENPDVQRLMSDGKWIRTLIDKPYSRETVGGARALSQDELLEDRFNSGLYEIYKSTYGNLIARNPDAVKSFEDFRTEVVGYLTESQSYKTVNVSDTDIYAREALAQRRREMQRVGLVMTEGKIGGRKIEYMELPKGGFDVSYTAGAGAYRFDPRGNLVATVPDGGVVGKAVGMINYRDADGRIQTGFIVSKQSKASVTIKDGEDERRVESGIAKGDFYVVPGGHFINGFNKYATDNNLGVDMSGVVQTMQPVSTELGGFSGGGYVREPTRVLDAPVSGQSGGQGQPSGEMWSYNGVTLPREEWISGGWTDEQLKKHAKQSK